MSLKNIVADYNAARERFQEEVSEKLKTAFTEFFQKNPEFRSIEWTQYTPYFNDGEPCEFSVGEIYYTLQPEFYAEDDRETIENDDYDLYELEEYRSLEGPSDWQRKSTYNRHRVEYWDSLTEEDKANRRRLEGVWDDFHSTLVGIPDDLYLDIFEDHSKVVVTADGIEITEYSHD